MSVVSIPPLPADADDPAQQYNDPEGRHDSTDLSDLYDLYDPGLVVPGSADWLTRVDAEEFRRDTRCLGEGIRLRKRLTDIVVSATALVLLAPVMLLVALAIRLTSKGPIIFRQERVGLNLRRNPPDRRQDAQPIEHADRRVNQDRRAEPTYGRHFTLYKFRTMTVDAEKHGAQFAQKADPRVTLIGGFLRKTRLDELPQLWNILKGEMSLVGPRPERPVFIEELSETVPNYLNRLGLKPGLTGLAQILNGYDNDEEGFRRKVTWDLIYLQNCCWWNDMKIGFRTFWVVITGQGQ